MPCLMIELLLVQFLANKKNSIITEYRMCRNNKLRNTDSGRLDLVVVLRPVSVSKVDPSH